MSAVTAYATRGRFGDTRGPSNGIQRVPHPKRNGWPSESGGAQRNCHELRPPERPQNNIAARGQGSSAGGWPFFQPTLDMPAAPRKYPGQPAIRQIVVTKCGREMQIKGIAITSDNSV
eukprot:3667823-Pyramimonas_sp.AAC.1